MARALYRIAEECIGNVAQHAEATRIRIQLNTTASTGYLSIQDDGSGLPENLSIGNGRGLDLARRYARLQGVSLILHTAPEAGSTVLCRFPLRMNQATTARPDSVAA
jgi:signal transduction histidine kinase